MTNQKKKDVRPWLAEAFRKLENGDAPFWITWNTRRLLIGRVDNKWLDLGVGRAIIATRRGYRIVDFECRAADAGTEGPRLLRPKKDYFNPVADKRVRAVILDEHQRP